MIDDFVALQVRVYLIWGHVSLIKVHMYLKSTKTSTNASTTTRTRIIGTNLLACVAPLCLAVALVLVFVLAFVVCLSPPMFSALLRLLSSAQLIKHFLENLEARNSEFFRNP